MASFFGESAKIGFFQQVNRVAPEISYAINEIFQRAQLQSYISAQSGITGALFLIFLSSLIFSQLRNSFDVIMENYPSQQSFSILRVMKKRGSSIFIALFMCLLFTVSLFISPLIKFFLFSLGHSTLLNPFLEMLIHTIFLTILFTGLFKLTPSKPVDFKSCLKMGVGSSFGFLVGNYLTGLYMKKIALTSIYGATGAILIFLLWAFYSALIIFLIFEGIIFLNKYNSSGNSHKSQLNLRPHVV